MDHHRSSNIFLRCWKWTKRNLCDGDPTGSHCKQDNPHGVTTESRVLDIQEGESAKMAALTQHAESLWTWQEARQHAVVERLGLSAQHATLPSPQPPALLRGSSKRSLQGWRISPLSDGPPLNGADIDRNQRSPKSLDGEEDDWMKVLFGSDKSLTASISSGSSLSLLDSHTPSELRAIPLIRSPVEGTPVPPSPSPPRAAPLSRRRLCRLPVLSAKRSGADKEVVGGVRPHSFAERLKFLQAASVPSPPSPVVQPLAPTPPTVPQTKRRGSQPWTFLRPAKPFCGAGEKTASDCSPQKEKSDRTVLKPLAKPVESLSHCFTLLSPHDWMKKVDGLKIVQALAQHHPETLTSKLHDLCLVLSEEVKNLRSAVACAAIDTLAEMYVHLQQTMDPEVERTGRALLLKLAQTTNAFIHQKVGLALDAMVHNCSHGRVVSTLLNTGLSHRCVAVRGSMAQHLHQVADGLGAAHILTAGRSFTERFLTAVCKMSVDAAPEVRHHGQAILRDLALHRDFMNLWKKIVPERERCRLDKIVQKAKT